MQKMWKTQDVNQVNVTNKNEDYLNNKSNEV